MIKFMEELKEIIRWRSDMYKLLHHCSVCSKRNFRSMVINSPRNRYKLDFPHVCMDSLVEMLFSSYQDSDYYLR